MSEPVRSFEVLGHALVVIPARTRFSTLGLTCRECGGAFELALFNRRATHWDLSCEACVALAKALGLEPPIIPGAPPRRSRKRAGGGRHAAR